MRIIDADPLWEQFRDQQCEFTKYSRYHQLNDEDKAAYDRLETVLEQIDSAPTLTLDDIVPHGRWVYEKTYQGMKYVCSECGEIPECFEPNYCPNCGCRMDGGIE